MKYILNSIKDVREIYTPDIEYLNDDFIEHLYEFKLSKKAILESMRFYQYLSIGEDYEKEDLSLKDYNFKNKQHYYKGINYNSLLKNINIEIFKTELEKYTSIQEDHFISKITEEIDNPIKFQKKLKEDVSNLIQSIKELESEYETANEFDKILIKNFIASYVKTYELLKSDYEKNISRTDVFNMKPQQNLKIETFNYLQDKTTPLMNFINLGIYRNIKKNKDTHYPSEKITTDYFIEAYNANFSVEDILSNPIKKLNECGFYKVLQNKYPEKEKQQSIISTIFRTHLKSTSIKYDIITIGTQYYNFCSKIGLIKHLEETEFKDGVEIAKLLNDFSKSKDENLDEITVKTIQNNHSNRNNPKSNYYPFSDGSNKKVNVILTKLNLIK